MVADEVRSLAQRAATAARDTAGLIQRSKDCADQGVAVAQRAKAVFAGIEQDTSHVAGLLNEMAAASTEVSAQADSVNPEPDRHLRQHLGDGAGRRDVGDPGDPEPRKRPQPARDGQPLPGLKWIGA